MVARWACERVLREGSAHRSPLELAVGALPECPTLVRAELRRLWVLHFGLCQDEDFNEALRGHGGKHQVPIPQFILARFRAQTTREVEGHII